MDTALFRFEEFASSPTAVALIFVCPYGTTIRGMRWPVRLLCRAGYHVVAYETTKDVFAAADPAILPQLILEMRKSISSHISRLKLQGIKEFGFFGSSLGSFILYNCIGDAIPELRWGVFNTGGNIAQGVWRMETARQHHSQQGISLPQLEAAWAGLQWPDFGRLDGCRFVFAGSPKDELAPLQNVRSYLEPMRRAGAQVSVLRVPAVGHQTAVFAGLLLAPRIVAMLRA